MTSLSTLDPSNPQARANRLSLTTSAVFSTLDRYELQECLSYMQNHWMLSIDDFKIPTEPPHGLISQLTPIKSSDPEQDNFWVLIPCAGDEKLDFTVLHQIVRELTVGIFVLNQIPTISLESNFDCGTSVQLPPAYIDTKVGQVLTNIDYMMKSLWHGAYLPKEKRQKFTDRWRKKLDINMETGKAESKTPHIMDFRGAGMIDVSEIKDYQDIYSSIQPEHSDDSESLESKRFFMDHAEDLSMRLNAYLNSVPRHKNMFVVDGDWIVSSVVKLTDDKIDQIGYERLQSRLRVHKNIIQENLDKENDIKLQLELLKLIAFLVPFFCALRRKMQIPDIAKLLPPLLGENIKTERELPPLMLGDKYKCKNFAYKDQMFSLHGGILIDIETPEMCAMDEALASQYEAIVESAESINDKALDISAKAQDAYEVPCFEVNNKKYHVLKIDLEQYYPQMPRKPNWVKELSEKIADLRPKRLPIQEAQMMDVFKKVYGFRKALKFKKEKIMSDEMNVPVGLKASAQRGLVSIFTELSRKSQMSQLMRQDESGLSLIHHAAIHNRPQIIARLILQSMDVNARRNQSVLSLGTRNYFLDGDEGSTPNQSDPGDGLFDDEPSNASNDANISNELYDTHFDATGPTALHLAARCGSLDAVACLCANYANILVMDHNGWAPIHQAAYYNHVAVIRSLVRKHDSLLELATQNDQKNTPMLLAASSGALEAVQCLIKLGAEVLRTNEQGHNMIHLAARRFHTNVLEYFIHNKHEGISVWHVLVDMILARDVSMQDASVRCLEILSLARKDYWKAIKEHNGIPALVKLLKSERHDIQSVAASVLCNISEEDDIRQCLADCGASKILIDLLSSPQDDIQSRAAIIISDIACVNNNQTELAQLGAIPPLIVLLDSELEDVLVNSVNCLRVLCVGNRDNQTAVTEGGAIEPLVEFLSNADSDILQSVAASAIAAICERHKENQDKFRDSGALDPLVKLIESKNMTVQVKASTAIEALATDNTANQHLFRQKEAPKHLIKLLKIFSLTVKETGACALWAIAGHTKPIQKEIANLMGVTTIIDLLLLKSEPLEYVGCMAMIALCRENVDNQNKVCDASGIEPLVRLIKSNKSSERVLMTAIKTLGILCIGVAHRNNKRTQAKIADNNALPILVNLLTDPPTQEIQVEVACTLACIVLGNHENQEKLKEIPSFTYTTLLNLLNAKNENIRLQAGTALATFGFNNTPQQYAIREAGGVNYSIFSPFLNSDDEFHRATASFQIVVLARVIVDKDQVKLTADGITELVRLLDSDVDNVVILSASLLSSLAHTRAGIPDAMETSGARQALVRHLDSKYDLVKSSCAVALGYMTFNRTSARNLLVMCRNKPDIHEKLMKNLGTDAKICEDFKNEFITAKKIGLPSQSLEENGGPPVCTSKRQGSARPKTGMSYKKEYRDAKSATSTRASIKVRAVSAPSKSRSHPIY